MTRYKNILAAVGEFPQDDDVLMRAAEIALIHKASLTVLHVIEFPEDFELATCDLVRLQQEAKREAREMIKAAIDRAAPDVEKADIFVEIGASATALIKHCETFAPDLVVVRAHQRESILTKLIGSTADRVIRGTSAPVLVVKRPAKEPYQRALLATDGREGGAEALNYLANLLPDAALHLVQVVTILPPLKQSLISTGVGQPAIDAHRAALIRAAKDNLKTLSNSVSDRVVTTRIATGGPGNALTNATRSPKTDLISVGPGRSSLLRRALIGSVTQKVIRDASCDVLVWRPWKAEE